MSEMIFFTQSDFSLGNSIMKIPEIVEAAKQGGYSAVALADDMSINGLMELTRECEKHDLKPIIGATVNVVDDAERKKEKGEKWKQLPWKPAIYCKTEEGLQRLMALMTLAFDQKYFIPRLSLDQVIEALDPQHHIVVFKDAQSALEIDAVSDIAEKLKRAVSASNVYFECLAVDGPWHERHNKEMFEVAGDSPIIVTRPSLYKKGQDEARDISMAIQGRSTIGQWMRRPAWRDANPKGRKSLVESAAQSKRSGEARYSGAQNWKDGILAHAGFISEISYRWAKSEPCLPKMADDEFDAMVAACKRGWKERFAFGVLGDLPDHSLQKEKYMPRLKYELDVIGRQNFAGYFLLVQDIVQWAKTNGVDVGPGRGSVGGSLVAYLMGITDVDPIRFNLIFERFINPDRLDLPDIDLDFLSTRRQDVIHYIEDKYGKEHVAGISNYGSLAAASALRDVARVFDISMKDMGFTKGAIKEHGNNLSLVENAEQNAQFDEFRKTRPDVWKNAVALEGKLRNYGRHAAGVIVAGEPLTKRAVVEQRKDGATINWDKRVCEDQGLIKLDVLGLSTLDVLRQAKEHIMEQHGVDLDLYKIPLDDEKVMKAFGAGDTVGIFQFESSGMRKLLKDMAQFEILNFEDITAATALYRPGPMDSGLMDDFVGAKSTGDIRQPEHDLMMPALESTYGVIVYQEQVMQVARDLAGFSMSEADTLRKAMGKKSKDLMAQMREKWVSGCDEIAGMPEQRANDLFDKIEAFAGYAFNKSHASAYSIVSYMAMYVKQYYPTEFYAAALAVMESDDKRYPLIDDMSRRKIILSPPDINHSTKRLEILNQETVLAPLNAVLGVSENSVNRILKERGKNGPFESIEDAQERMKDQRRFFTSRQQDRLNRVGAFARIEEGQLDPNHEERLRDQKEFLPGFITASVVIHRVFPDRKLYLPKIKRVTQEAVAMMPAGMRILPTLGKQPKFMVVADCPNRFEEEEGKMTKGIGFSATSEALAKAHLSVQDGYWTSLCKIPKSGQYVSAEEIDQWQHILQKELDVFQPPLVITLGSAAARWFVPDLKGNILDHAGKVHYDKVRDMNVLIGFNPSMIFFDPGRQVTLDAVFETVANMTV